MAIIAIVYMWLCGSIMYAFMLKHVNEPPNFQQWIEMILWPLLIPAALVKLFFKVIAG